MNAGETRIVRDLRILESYWREKEDKAARDTETPGDSREIFKSLGIWNGIRYCRTTLIDLINEIESRP